MKKAISCILVCLLLLVVTGCTSDQTLKDAYEKLDLGDLTGVTKDLTLPTKDGEVTIQWKSNNEEVITNVGKVTRPNHDSSNANVKLTATLSYNEEDSTKDFNVIVLKEEGPTIPTADVIAFTDTTVSAGIKISIVPNDTNHKVYYAIVEKTTNTYTDAEIKSGTHSDFVSSGSKVGGYLAYSISQLVSNTTYTVLCVVEDTTNNLVSRVDAVEVNSSEALFFNGEDVKELGYIPIYNLRDLEEYSRGYGTDYSFEMNVELMADIDMSVKYGENKETWDPIDNPNNNADGSDATGTEFKGIFDGNGFTIKGLYIDSDEDMVGFYRKVDTKGQDPEGTLPSATFRDLTFEDATVIARHNTNLTRSTRGVGVLAGYFRGGLISNVNVIGNSKVELITEKDNVGYVGGLVGWVQSNGWTTDRGNVSLTIENCMTDMDVIAPNANNAGGLVGRMDESTSGAPWVMKISNCYTLGNTTGRITVGGIVGAIRGQIENCVAYGEVNSNNGASYAGGVAGHVENLRRAGNEDWNTSIVNVAYMGISEVNVVNFLEVKVDDVITEYTNIENSNIYTISFNSILDVPNKPVVTTISYNDFVTKNNVTGFDNWQTVTIEDVQYLVPTIS